MDGPQRNTTAATGREDDELQQRQREEREAERATGAMRDQATSIRIQTRPSNPGAAARQQEGIEAEQLQHGQDYQGVAMGGGGYSVLSARSDTSDRAAFEWQEQDHHCHYSSSSSFTAAATGDKERHAMPGVEVRHGTDRWIPPPPPPPLLSLPSSQDPKHQQNYLTTQHQQNRSWSATTVTASPKSWARQTRIWLRRYFSTSTESPLSGHHPLQQRQFDQRHSAFGSDDSPLASASSTSSTSTLLSDGGFHSRHHPYFQKGHRRSESSSSVASSATFMSSGDIESARLKKEQHFLRSPLTLQWTITTPRSFSLSFRMPRVWNIFGRSRNRTSPLTSSFSSSSTSLACLRLFTRRRKRTLFKWAWAASLMLVMTLGVYITVVGIFRIHGYLASDLASGRNEDLVSTGREVWRRVAMGKIIRKAGQGGFTVELDAGKTTTVKQKDVVPSSATALRAAAVVGAQDQAAKTPSGSIWVRQAEDEMDDPLDFYPDEDEDDPSEAASFISWLAQASFATPTIQHQQDQHQQKRRPQQYQEHLEPVRPPLRQQQQQTGHESVLQPERYFTYMPFAGISNQFYGMLRAMTIARALNRTLILPPITSSSHDKSRQNQAWSNFFDLNEFRRRTDLKVVEYQDLRDQGLFRGPTGVQESGSSVGASWIPLWTKEASAAAATKPKEKRGGRYQHSLGTGTAAIDMTIPCHVTCGFGSKRDLDFTAKAFVRQWGFQYKKQMLPESLPPQPPVPIDTSPIDQTRDLDRIVAALQDASLKTEGFLCISNTYKIQISPAAIPASSLVDSIEWHEFGQHLLFQPTLTQFVNEFLDRTFGEHPEERSEYTNDTFWISTQAPSAPPPAPSPFSEPVLASPPSPQVDLPPLEPSVQPMAVAVNNPPSPPQSPPMLISYAASVDLTPWPPLRPLIQHTFFMIHVRRRDFEAYCRKDFKGELFDQCLPSNEAYARVVDELQERALKVSDKDGLSDEMERGSRRKGGRRRRIPVLVATNENRPEELAQLRQLGRFRRVRNPVVGNEQAVVQGSGVGGVVLDVEGEESQGRDGGDGGVASDVEEQDGEEWVVLDHDEMRTVERLGVFGPMMVEQLLMAEAEALVGVRMSTFSRVGGYRQWDWYHRRILYM